MEPRWNRCETEVEPRWNRGVTEVEPRWKGERRWNGGGTEVEPRWNGGGTEVGPTWNRGGTEVEPMWNLYLCYRYCNYNCLLYDKKKYPNKRHENLATLKNDSHPSEWQRFLAKPLYKIN